jgi:hypothetical protein
VTPTAEAAEDRGGRIHAPSIRARLCNNKARDDALDVPAEAQCDLARKPLLLVQSREQLLRVIDAGLELAHHERASRGMERKVIDGATFPIDVVRDFLAIDPAAGSNLAAAPRSLERGMVGVEQAIELAASPDDLHEKPSIERIEDTDKYAERHRASQTSLESRDGRCAAASAPPEVSLGPSVPMPQRPNAQPDPILPHAQTVQDPGLPAD